MTDTECFEGRRATRRRSPAALALVVAGAALAATLLPALAFAGKVDVMKLPEDAGATAWMLSSTALVLLMIPGLAMFYGGLVRSKNVLGTMMHSFAAMAVIGVLWPLVGYALCFGTTQRGIIGWDSSKAMLSGIDTSWTAILDNTRRIPEYVFAMFQGKFAIITPALIAGAFAERVRFGPYLIFIALWSLVVYCPLAHMIWGGGALTGEAIDLAGGTVIHISAGVAGLVAAIYLGGRRGHPRPVQPNNMVMTMTGAGLLWVGWFGFNAGSQVSSGLATAQALTMTQIAAASGGLGWMIVERLIHKKYTALGIISGILAGLVAITPAAGAVKPLGAIILGLVASPICYLAIALKNKLGYDDTLDAFGIHGVAGIVGALGLVAFLRDAPKHGVATQLWYQAKGVLVAAGVSAVATLVLVLVIDKTLGMRMQEEDEITGMDQSLHGERGYDIRSF